MPDTCRLTRPIKDACGRIYFIEGEGGLHQRLRGTLTLSAQVTSGESMSEVSPGQSARYFVSDILLKGKDWRQQTNYFIHPANSGQQIDTTIGNPFLTVEE